MLVVADIGIRTAGIAVSGTTELTEVLLVIAIFAGLAYTQSEFGNIGMELVANALSPERKRLARLGSVVLCLVICTVLAVGTGKMALQSLQLGEYMSTSVNLPLWPGKAVICAGFVFLSIELALQIRDLLFGGDGEVKVEKAHPAEHGL